MLIITLLSLKVTIVYASVMDTTFLIITSWCNVSETFLDNHYVDPVSVLKIKLSDLGYIYTLSYKLWFASKAF